MLVLCSNHSSTAFHQYAMKHQGKLGWMLGPSSWKTPRGHLPWALDNDAFSAWVNKSPWDSDAWLRMLGKARAQASAPMFILVPDVVADREATLASWNTWHATAGQFGWPLAFAVQDGMQPGDVPKNAAWVFIGGTTKWKWRTLPMWCVNFPMVHIGRVTTGARLEIAERNGAKSCDGTGFFRGSWHSPQARQLRAFVEGHRDTTLQLL